MPVGVLQTDLRRDDPGTESRGSAGWKCAACTFENFGSLEICEICGTAKLVPAAFSVSPCTSDEEYEQQMLEAMRVSAQTVLEEAEGQQNLEYLGCLEEAIAMSMAEERSRVGPSTRTSAAPVSSKAPTTTPAKKLGSGSSDAITVPPVALPEGWRRLTHKVTGEVAYLGPDRKRYKTIPRGALIKRKEAESTLASSANKRVHA